MNKENKEIGLRIRKARENKGLSQAKLAQLCGWGEDQEGQSRVSNYERGTREATLDVYRTICQHIGLDLQEALFGHPLRPDADEDLLVSAIRVATDDQRKMLISLARSIIPENRKNQSRTKKSRAKH